MSDINITVQDEIVNIDILDEPVLVNVVNSPGVPGAPGVGVPVGGTTGQVLAKNSNTNYDTEWVDVSGGTWGSITGTLSDQTDLQSALDAKVPYTGAMQDVSLGEYGINVGNVIYDTTPTGIPTDQGATYWDEQAETVALVMNGTIQKIGEDTFYHVKNSTGSTIAKGVAVRFAGTDGGSGKILIAPFTANGTYPTQYYMGITAEAITNGSNGKVYHFGKIRGVNTSAFADGDILYCSTSVAGGFQTTAPSAPNNIVIAAAVINAGNNGTLMVRTTTGSNINTDEGVLITSAASGQVLKYNGSLWVNDSVSGALGYTPANAATTLTINGVTYDLSANRSWTIAAGITGSGASGQVAYWTGTSAQSGSANFLWDNTNSNLAIGAATTWQAGIGKLSVVNGATDAPILSLKNTDATKQVYYASYNDSNKSLQYIVYGSTAPGTLLGQFRANAAVILGYNTPSVLAIGNFENVPIVLGTNNAERLRIFGSTGNVGINTGSSDSGERLQVTGDVKIKGSGNTNATTALTVQNSSSQSLLSVKNNGQTTLTGITNNDTTNIFRIEQQNGNGRFLVNASGQVLITGDSFQSTENFVSISRNSFNPTNGSTTHTTLLINPVINQTGGANGITRGLYVNPNLTAAADWRSIEWSNNSGWGLYGAGTANNYLGGNLLLGSTSNSGERLQVTGNAKLTGVAGNNFSVINSSAQNNFTIADNGSFNLGGTTTTLRANISTSGFSCNLNVSTLNIANWNGNVFARFNGLDAPSATFIFGGTSVNASAKLQIDSTTQGFLPPRMTTTQKNAITSPAAGLVVYDTTDNKHYGYNGTTWNAFY